MFVYLITNTVNGKRYVGQTNQTLARRWAGHTRKDNCRYLYAAIMKYGKANFIIESIIEVPTKELANEFEIEYIEKYCTLAPNGYNIFPGGDDRPPLTEEQRKRLSERMKGNTFAKGFSPSEETREKLRLANAGKVLSEEHKRKISESHVGITHSEETKKVMSTLRKGCKGPNLGKKFSEESKKRMRKAKLGRILSDEVKMNMALSQQARRLSESKDSVVRHRSEEAKQKMSNARKSWWEKKRRLSE
jgi:group I intron endonuclease